METIKEGESIYKLDMNDTPLRSGTGSEVTFVRWLRAMRGDGSSHCPDGYHDWCASAAVFQLATALTSPGNR